MYAWYASVYLTQLVNVYNPLESLRPRGPNLFIVPRVDTRYGNQSFAYAAPYLWNSLPETLRTMDSLPAFKKALKTHLFKLAFN